MLCSRNLLGIPLRKLGEDVKATTNSSIQPTIAQLLSKLLLSRSPIKKPSFLSCKRKLQAFVAALGRLMLSLR